jgi:hypothetical protein
MLMSIATGYEGRPIYVLLCTENGYNFDILLQAADGIFETSESTWFLQ